MTTGEMFQLENRIRDLWPTFFRCNEAPRGRDPQVWSAAMLDKLRPYALREVLAGLQECLTTGKGYLNEAAIVKMLRAKRHIERIDPMKWTIIDEHWVQMRIAKHREWLGNGTYVRMVEAGKISEIPDEYDAEEAAIRSIGKNPSAEERYEAIRMLNRHISDANARMESHGSKTRLCLYPEPLLPLERQNGECANG